MKNASDTSLHEVLYLLFSNQRLCVDKSLFSGGACYCFKSNKLLFTQQNRFRPPLYRRTRCTSNVLDCNKEKEYYMTICTLVQTAFKRILNHDRDDGMQTVYANCKVRHQRREIKLNDQKFVVIISMSSSY